MSVFFFLKKGLHRERKGRDNCLVFAILNRMIGAGLPEKVTLEERLLGGQGANHANMRGKSIPGGGICK